MCNHHIIAKYQNGNTKVIIYNDGTKERVYDSVESIYINHPESIDVKITNYCTMGCEYCHESSTKDGKHADLNVLLTELSCLPKGVELAIGGGNPLDHPNLFNFLLRAKIKGFICNLTVNQGHLQKHFKLLEELIECNLIKGLGISITSKNFKYVKKLKSLTNNIVYHIIVGVNEINVIDELIKVGDNCKILVLGYKQFGFGINYYSTEVQDCLNIWYRKLPSYLNKCTLSFDNLAIEQLKVKDLFSPKGWEKFYMGDDFTFTMYIDAVKQEYAPTSRSVSRKSFNEISLLDYFKNK